MSQCQDKKLYELQDGTCFYCGEKIGPRRWFDYTRDHFFPKSKGNGAERNTVLCCPNCNTQKADRMPTIDEEILFYYMILLKLGRAVAYFLLNNFGEKLKGAEG